MNNTVLCEHAKWCGLPNALMMFKGEAIYKRDGNMGAETAGLTSLLRVANRFMYFLSTFFVPGCLSICNSSLDERCAGGVQGVGEHLMHFILPVEFSRLCDTMRCNVPCAFSYLARVIHSAKPRLGAGDYWRNHVWTSIPRGSVISLLFHGKKELTYQVVDSF